MDDDTGLDGRRRLHFMQSSWAQVVVVVTLVVAFALVVVWAAKRDVVANWKVLATCAAPAGTAIERSTPLVDVTPCSRDQVDVLGGRGWPILTFVLPATAGVAPQLTGLTSNKETRTVELHFDSSAANEPMDDDHILVFVEVPPDSLPQPPFSIRDAEGSTTVTALHAP